MNNLSNMIVNEDIDRQEQNFDETPSSSYTCTATKASSRRSSSPRNLQIMMFKLTTIKDVGVIHVHGDERVTVLELTTGASRSIKIPILLAA